MKCCDNKNVFFLVNWSGVRNNKAKWHSHLIQSGANTAENGEVPSINEVSTEGEKAVTPNADVARDIAADQSHMQTRVGAKNVHIVVEVIYGWSLTRFATSANHISPSDGRRCRVSQRSSEM